MPWQFHVMAIIVGWFSLIHFIDMMHWIKPSDELLEMFPYSAKQRICVILLKIVQWTIAAYLVS